jgi:hypothetical protein
MQKLGPPGELSLWVAGLGSGGGRQSPVLGVFSNGEDV